MATSELEDPDAWKDIDECEVCGAENKPLRAIKMREGRRQMLCRPCFKDKLDASEVDPTDPRVGVSW